MHAFNQPFKRHAKFRMKYFEKTCFALVQRVWKFKLWQILNAAIIIKKWALTRENLSSGFATNTGADQPTHPRSLISAFVIRLLETIISKLAPREISIFLTSLCSWGDWFESRFVGNPENKFSRSEAHMR